MKFIRNAVGVLAMVTVAMAGCSSGTQDSSGSGQPSQGSTGETGNVGLQLQIGPGLSINTVSYTISNSTILGFATIANSFDVSGSSTISFSIALPVGSGYQLTLSATDSAGDPCSGGPVTFSVSAGMSNPVALSLTCVQTVDSGVVGPDVNVGQVTITADASLETMMNSGGMCAAVQGLTAAPGQTSVGHSVSLSGSGIDSTFQSSDVTLTWSATGGAGSLSATTGTATSFACTSAGTETITLSASITSTGASCAGIGSLSVSVICTGAAGGEDAGAEDAAVDTGVVDTGVVDTGVVDSGIADTGIDSATVDAGVDAALADAGSVDAGPPEPCTSAGQTGCVKCDGVTTGANAGVCTPEEAIFAQKDITNHLYSGLQLNKSGANRSCYECLVAAGCVDTNTNHGSECGDLTGTISAGASAGKTLAQACLDTINCIEGSAPSSNPDVTPATDCANDSNNGGANCYCGPALDDSTMCNSAAASAVNGSCAQVEVNGFGATTATAPSTILGEFTDLTTGSGMANGVFNCAGANSGVANCPQCL